MGPLNLKLWTDDSCLCTNLADILDTFIHKTQTFGDNDISFNWMKVMMTMFSLFYQIVFLLIDGLDCANWSIFNCVCLSVKG